MSCSWFYMCFYVFAQKSLLHKTHLDWLADSLTPINSIHSPINCMSYKAIFDAAAHDILCRLSRYRAFAVRCPVHNWIQWNFQLQSALGICLIWYPRIRPTENTKKIIQKTSQNQSLDVIIHSTLDLVSTGCVAMLFSPNVYTTFLYEYKKLTFLISSRVSAYISICIQFFPTYAQVRAIHEHLVRNGSPPGV